MRIEESHPKNEHLLNGPFWLLVGGLAIEAGGAASGLVSARVLGPVGLGIVGIVMLIVQYVGYSDLGLGTALVRRVPILRGQGDHAEVLRVQRVVFTDLLILVIAGTVVIWSLYWAGVDFGGKLTLTVMVLLTATLWTDRLLNFLSRTFKAEGWFAKLGQRSLVAGVVQPLLIIPLVLMLGLTGYLLAGVLASCVLIMVMLVRSQTRRWFTVAPDWRRTKSLVKEGLQSFLVQHGVRFLVTLELTVLAIMMGAREVGLFSFGLGMLALADRLPESIDPIILRRMLYERGQMGSENYEYLGKYLGASYASYLLLSAVAAGACYFLYAAVIFLVLPAYEPALSFMPVLVLGYMFYRTRQVAVHALNVQDRLTFVIVIQASILALNLVLDILLIGRYGMVGAAWGSTIAYVVFAAFMVLAGVSGVRGKAAGARIFVKLVGAALTSFAVLLGLYELGSMVARGEGWTRFVSAGITVLLQTVVFSVVTAGIFVIWFSGEGVWPFLRKMITEARLAIQGVILPRRGRRGRRVDPAGKIS